MIVGSNLHSDCFRVVIPLGVFRQQEVWGDH